MLTMGKSIYFKNETEDDTINTFISIPHALAEPTWKLLESIMSCEIQEIIKLENEGEYIPVTTLFDSIIVEIKSRKTLNINLNLSLA